MEFHVLQLRDGLPSEIGGVHWLALGTPETSVYVPFYSGITETPVEYRIGSDVYGRNSAYWAYRSIGALAYTNFEEYSKLIIPEWQNLEEKFFNEQKNVDTEAVKLYKQNPKKAAEYLTNYSKKNAVEALDKSNTLLSKIIIDSTKLKAPVQ